MTVTVGGVAVAAVFVGATPAAAVYVGAVKAWEPSSDAIVDGVWQHIGTTTTNPANGQSRYRGSNTTFRFAYLDADGADTGPDCQLVQAGDLLWWEGDAGAWPITAVSNLPTADPPAAQLTLDVTGGVPANLTGRYRVTITRP